MKMYMKTKYFNALLLSTLILILSACGSDTESSIQTPMSEVDLGIQTSVTNTVIVAADDFSETITALNTHIEGFCSAVNTDNLSTLQNAWKASFVAWYALMPFQVGPLTLTDDNSAILNYVDFYRNATRASRTSNLADINSGLGDLMSGGAVTDTSLSNALTKNVGLLVLETALFSTISNSTAAADIVTEFTGPSKKCDIIRALGHELNERASDIQSQWKTDYRSTGLSYLDLFTSNQLENYFSSFDSQGDGVGTPASEILIVALQEFLDFIGNADLFIELLRYSSDFLWDALAASIDSIERILDQSAKTELSLYAIIKNNGYGQDVETIRQNIVLIRQTIRDKNIVDFKAAAKALDGNFKTSVIDGLNINKGLIFADGDS
jgi:hypothetical protein